MASELAIGKYDVLQQIGTGAHSTILAVRRADDRKVYALKVVSINSSADRKFLEQVQHEYRIGQLLHHPCLIQVYALEVEKDWLFRPRKAHLLTEYVAGKTLDACPALSLAILVQIFEQVAGALVHMHSRHVFHGDLKPNNIMISRAGEVKIIDYGLAGVRGEPRERVQGTPEYIAPEQVKTKVINEKTDLYNLGATMYRMVTGRLPPSALPQEDGALRSADKKAMRLMLQPVQELRADAPPLLCNLIDRCLAYKPPQRPENATEAQAILHLLAEKLVQSEADKLEMIEL
jgi:serine/threonine protein kinase